MYINLHLPLFNFVYLVFLFFLSFPLNVFVSFIFIVIFPNWHLALVLFSSLCFLISFVLVDILFSFLCSPGQSIAFHLCWTLLILLMGVNVNVHICQMFYCRYKPLPLHWAFAVLWHSPNPQPFSFFFCFFSFPFFYNFDF